MLLAVGAGFARRGVIDDHLFEGVGELLGNLELHHGRLFMGGNGGITHLVENNAVATDTDEYRRRGNAGLFEPLTQHAAEGSCFRRVGAAFFFPGSGSLDVHAAGAQRRGDDLELLIVPIKGQETWQVILSSRAKARSTESSRSCYKKSKSTRRTKLPVVARSYS